MQNEPEQSHSGDTNEPSALRRSSVLKMSLLLAVIGATGFVWWHYREVLSLSWLAERESVVRGYQQTQPLLMYGAAFMIYVAVTGMSLPGATAMTLACAWLFGFWRALLLVSFASTTGATLAFLLSRYVLRDSVQRRFGSRLESFNESLEREGPFYLFALRLIPAVPFFVINVVMGLTPIRVVAFWWISQVGMLPGTAVYVWAGASVPSLKTLAEQGTSGILKPELIAAFVVLGLFPFVVKKLLAGFRRRTELKDAS